MTRDIEYLQYHSRYSSQNFKRNVASYTPTATVTEFTNPNQIPAIYFI